MRVVSLVRRGTRCTQASFPTRKQPFLSHRSKALTQRPVSTAAITAAERAQESTAVKPQAPNSLMYWPKVYMELGKFRLSGLVVSTTVSGYYMGCAQFDPGVFACTVAGTTLAALSANTFNQWIEVANDSKMGRTIKRPLPSGRISPNHALAAAVTQGIAGPALLTAAVNPLAGGIAASTIVLYAGCYTPLKVVHPINTWVGAVVGGLPPLIGYAAATGHIDIQALLLGGILYSWQFPHFMALAHYCKKDYMAGGYKMLSDKAAAAVALRHCAALGPLCLAVPYLGLTTWEFGAESLAINAIFAYYGYKFWQHPNIPNARSLFRTSLWQLPLLLTCMAVHKIAREEEGESIMDKPARGTFSDILPKKCTARAMGDIANGPSSA